MDQPIIFSFEHNCSTGFVECSLNGKKNSVCVTNFPEAHPLTNVVANATIKEGMITDQGLNTLKCSVDSETYTTVIAVTNGRSTSRN